MGPSKDHFYRFISKWIFWPTLKCPVILNPGTCDSFQPVQVSAVTVALSLFCLSPILFWFVWLRFCLGAHWETAGPESDPCTCLWWTRANQGCRLVFTCRLWFPAGSCHTVCSEQAWNWMSNHFCLSYFRGHNFQHILFCILISHITSLCY